MSRLSSVRVCSTWAQSEAHLAPQRAVQVSVVTAMANVDLSGEMPTRRRGLLETCHHLFLRGLRSASLGSSPAVRRLEPLLVARQPLAGFLCDREDEARWSKRRIAFHERGGLSRSPGGSTPTSAVVPDGRTSASAYINQQPEVRVGSRDSSESKVVRRATLERCMRIRVLRFVRRALSDPFLLVSWSARGRRAHGLPEDDHPEPEATRQYLGEESDDET